MPSEEVTEEEVPEVPQTFDALEFMLVLVLLV